MPINVKHGANPSVVLAARYAAGQSGARAKAQVAGAHAADRHETREDRQDFQREMTEGQRDFRREMVGEGRDFQREMAGGQLDRQKELAEFGQGLREEDFEFRLTTQQKADEERWRNGYAEAKASGAFSEKEMEEVERQYLTRMMGNKPLLKRKDPSKYPKGQGIGDVWVNRETGEVERRDSKGDVKSSANPRLITSKDIEGFAKSTPVTYKDGDPVPATEAAIAKHVRFMVKLRREANASIYGESGGQPLDPSAALEHQASPQVQEPSRVYQDLDSERAVNDPYVAAPEPRKKLFAQMQAYQDKGLGYPAKDAHAAADAYRAFDAARAANSPVEQGKAWDIIKALKKRYSKDASKASRHYSGDGAFDFDMPMVAG